MGKVCQTQKNVLIRKTKPKSNVIHTKRDIELCEMMSEPVSISLHESSSKSKEEAETVLKKTSALRVNKANYHTALKIC